MDGKDMSGFGPYIFAALVIRIVESPHRREGPDPTRHQLEAAYRYAQACETQAKAPVQVVADQMFLSRDRIRDLLHDARRNGYLTKPPKKGTAGGELTAEGVAAGQHVKVIQERWGHSSPAFTLTTYTHVYDGLDKTTAEALDGLIGHRAVGSA